MKLKKLSQREKATLYLTISIIVAVVLFNLIINPTLDKMSGINQEIERKTALLERYSGLINRGEDVFALYEEHKDILEKQIEPDEITNNLFNEIAGLANKSEVKIKRVKPMPVTKRGEYSQAFLEVELEGKFQSIFKLINNLETSSALIKISSLRLLPGPQSSKDLRCRLILFKIIF